MPFMLQMGSQTSSELWNSQLHLRKAGHGLFRCYLHVPRQLHRAKPYNQGRMPFGSALCFFCRSRLQLSCFSWSPKFKRAFQEGKIWLKGCSLGGVSPRVSCLGECVRGSGCCWFVALGANKVLKSSHVAVGFWVPCRCIGQLSKWEWSADSTGNQVQGVPLYKCPLPVPSTRNILELVKRFFQTTSLQSTSPTLSRLQPTP